MKSSQLLLKSIARGFTLVELLMASAMTLIVVTLAGIAVAQVIQGNLQTRADSQLQYNTNRATEYISDEIRKATIIETDITTEFNRLKAIGYTGFDQTMTPVLILTIPDVGEKVVYYTIPRSRVNSESETMYQNHKYWLVGKPDSSVLYRWGYDRTREQATPNDKNTPSEWKPQPILDNVDSTTTTASCGQDPTAAGFNPAVGIIKYLTPVPASSPKGFYTCVSSNKKFAELRLKVSYQETNDAVTVQKPIQYEVKTQVATRASNPFIITGTTLTFISPGTVDVERGGDKESASGTSDSLGTVSVPITDDSKISIPGQLPIGQPIRITLISGNNRFTTSDNPNNANARAYYNRSPIPTDIPGDYIPNSWKDSENPSIFKLDSNQIIIRLNKTLYKFTVR